MKFILLIVILSSFLQSNAQFFKRKPAHVSPSLVATNGKTTRWYTNSQPLKVHYHKNGDIVKAKGYLLIDSNQTVDIIPFTRKPKVEIQTDSITSISRWNRKGKKRLAILTGTGVALGALAVLSESGSSDGGVVDNPAPLLLLIYVALDGYYIAIAAPIIFIGEWLSLRSQKRGYHFSIE